MIGSGLGVTTGVCDYTTQIEIADHLTTATAGTNKVKFCLTLANCQVYTTACPAGQSDNGRCAHPYTLDGVCATTCGTAGEIFPDHTTLVCTDCDASTEYVNNLGTTCYDVADTAGVCTADTIIISKFNSLYRKVCS